MSQRNLGFFRKILRWGISCFGKSFFDDLKEKEKSKVVICEVILSNIQIDTPRKGELFSHWAELEIGS